MCSASRSVFSSSRLFKRRRRCGSKRRRRCAQIEKRVEPVIPEAAAVSRIGGDVIADVIVGSKGDGDLGDGRRRARDAARRGHHGTQAVAGCFKPFVRRGKPVSVLVILEVAFPDPARDEERRAFDEHRAAERRCLEAMDRDPGNAPAVCVEVVRRSTALPKDRVPERVHTAYTLHANSLIRAGRLHDAIARDRTCDRTGDLVNRPADAGTAGLVTALPACCSSRSATQNGR